VSDRPLPFEFLSEPPPSATVTIDADIHSVSELFDALASGLGVADYFRRSWIDLRDFLITGSWRGGTDASIDHASLPSLSDDSLNLYVRSLADAVECKSADDPALRVTFRTADAARVAQLITAIPRPENAFDERFNAAMAAKHTGDSAGAIATLTTLLTEIASNEPHQVSIVCQQLGHLHGHDLGNYAAAGEFFRRAVEARPRAELASRGLFHSLVHLGAWEEAMFEAIRFLRLRTSRSYRSMFLSDGFGADLSPEARELLAEARALLLRN